MTLVIIVLATASEAKGLNSLKHSLFPNKSEVGRTAQPIVRSEKILARYCYVLVCSRDLSTPSYLVAGYISQRVLDYL